MRKYLIASIMVHIGMILIQGERTFIIFFFECLQLIYVLFRLVVAKKEKNNNNNNLDGEGYEVEKFLYERSKSD